MTKFWQKVTLFSASLSSTLILATNPVQAALLNFTVSIDSGPLDGQTFLGSFDFDGSGLTEIGTEFLPVSELTFNFFNTTFTEADDLLGSPEVTFFDGEFLGLSFLAENSQVSFSFNPGFFQVSEASFAYEIIASSDQGFGDVTFEQVPEPMSVFSVLAVSLLGFVIVIKRHLPFD